MVPAALIPWLEPETLISGAGPYALLLVCFIVFAETGLLVGFLLPGDTLLIITGVLAVDGLIGIDIWWICLAIAVAAFLGGEVGYLIGHRFGPRIFEKKESGLFSVKNVQRTNAFFTRFGALAVIVARFVPIVRTFAPVAAGVGHMDYRKYSLYNAIGALIWGAGLTYVGYLVGNIPFIRHIITEYIDLILIGAVLIAVVPTALHYWQSTRKAKQLAMTASEDDLVTDASEAASLALDPEVFDRHNNDDSAK